MHPVTEGRLKQAGLRLTQPRLTVLDVLENEGKHREAEFIWRAAQLRLPTLARQSVYDNLNALVAAGIVRRIEPAGSPALYETRAGLTAEQASRRIGGTSSIAAHVLHTTHYLKMSNAHGRGQAFEADWDGSWARQVVTEEEWAGVQSDLVDQKTLLLELMSQHGLPDDAVLGAIANIAHAAFHLGAIRQLVAAAE